MEPFVKSEFYDVGNFAVELLSTVSERDPKKHAEMRRYLSSAFSDRFLKSQEPHIAESVDRLVDKLEEAGRAAHSTNVVMWFNLVTFDIISSFAFGKDLCGIRAGKEHFWVADEKPAFGCVRRLLLQTSSGFCCCTKDVFKIHRQVDGGES